MYERITILGLCNRPGWYALFYVASAGGREAVVRISRAFQVLSEVDAAGVAAALIGSEVLGVLGSEVDSEVF